MTISEVSKKYGLTADTLRYYERIGLIPTVPRKQNGIRDYDEIACQWVEFVKCMREAGVEIEALIEFVKLKQKDVVDYERLMEILNEQRKKLINKIDHLNETIDRLDYKIKYFGSKLSK